MKAIDWEWKLREAIYRLKNQYEHIGRSSGAPFIAIIYPVEAERAVYKEWRTLVNSLGDEFEVYSIDALAITMEVVEEIGTENIVKSLTDPMPGSNPESDIGVMWANSIAERVCEIKLNETGHKPVIVLERLAALCPATTPRALMQRLWDSEQSCFAGPIIVLIPGNLIEPRVYSFVGCREELMYRGDIL